MIDDPLNRYHRELTVLPFANLARCAEVDSDLWFPEKGKSPKAAISICNKCEVQVECLEWALENSEQFGIWGAKTTKARNKISRERAS